MRNHILVFIFLICPLFLNAVQPVVIYSGLYNDPDGQTTDPTDTLTGNNEMTMMFRVSDADGYTNIQRVNVLFWNTVSATQTDPPSDAYLAEYNYYSDFDDWSLVGPGSWSLDELNSTGPASTNTSVALQAFYLVFTPGPSAVEASGNDWAVRVEAIDNSGASTNVVAYYKLMQFDTDSGSTPGSGRFYAAPTPYSQEDSGGLTFYYEPDFGGKCTVDFDIYTLSGELVIKLLDDKVYASTDTLSENWDGKNGVGRDITTGVYAAVLTVTYDTGLEERETFLFAVTP